MRKQIKFNAISALVTLAFMLCVATPFTALAVTWSEYKTALDAAMRANREAAIRLPQTEAQFNQYPSLQEGIYATARAAALPPGPERDRLLNDVNKQAGKAIKEDASLCIPFISFEFGKCIFIPAMGWLGSWMLWFSMFILKAAGFLFNMLVQYIVVGFGSTIQALGLQNGIHTGWEVLRDISNIVIIGMFTFIAISMILGIEKFGAKRLVANVLVIAILINFSLLFSKIIIDAGNFTAYQIYKGMGSGADDSGTNIANKFLSIIGITGAADTSIVAQSFGKQLQQSGIQAGDDSWSNSALAGVGALFFGIIAGSMLLLAAGVLLYGSYLIAARAVLLVFLMLVSALAFASYLVPKLAEKGYGFNTWLRSLINASIFAPLLMILLYVSLLILTPAAGPKGVTLGNLAANPANLAQGQNWKTLVIFIFGIGMLYVSFRVANSFSNQIAGFSTAAIPIAKTFGLGAGISGFLGRNIIGRTGSGVARAIPMRKRMEQVGVNDDGSPRMALVTKPDGWIRGGFRGMAGKAASSSFDARKIPGVAAGTKFLGLDVGKEQGKGGFLHAQDEKERRLIEREAAMAKLMGRKTSADRAETPEDRKARQEKDHADSEQKLKEARTQLAEAVNRGKDVEAQMKRDQAKSTDSTADKKESEPEEIATPQPAAQQTGTAQQEKERTQIMRSAVEQGVRTAVQGGIKTTQTAEDAARAQTRAKQEGESTRRQSGANIEQAVQKAGHEVDNELETKLKAALDDIEKFGTAVKQEEARIARIKTGADYRAPEVKRREDYIESLRDKRYLSFGLAKRPEIADKVGGEVRKSKEIKMFEEIAKSYEKSQRSTEESASRAATATEKTGDAVKKAADSIKSATSSEKPH